MIQRFTDVTDKRVLSYSSQILLNVVEAEFTQQQEQSFLEMHGFNSNVIPEILDLGTKMNERFTEFQMAIQNSLYTLQVQKINQDIEEKIESAEKTKEGSQTQAQKENQMDLETQSEP